MLLKSRILSIISLFLYIGTCFGFFEIIPAIGSYVYQNICLSGSCCTDREIPAKFEVLENQLSAKVFGQPLIQNTVVRALKSHWSSRHKPNKALTISFHGGPGIGKNYVVRFIQEALYAKGSKSPHVHNFVSRLEFPEASKVEIYKKNLAKWITGNVTNCPKQIFVFDEVSHMPPGVLDVIKPFIDYVDYVNGVSYRESIFIFMSNTGSQIINDLTYELWKRGIPREDLKLKDFEKLIAQGAFNEGGGFQHSDTIKSNLIDHYIPFLPLMEPQVRLCIKEEFRLRGIENPPEEYIKEVLEFIDWHPNIEKIFAKTGCKRISQKVGLLVY